MSTIRLFEEDGAFTAYNEDTGTKVTGRTKSQALIALAEKLESERDGTTTVEQYEELCEDVQRRFEKHDVSEEVVEEAIEWARRQ